MTTRLLTILFFMPFLAAMNSCKSTKPTITGPAPKEARPEDIAKADEFFAAGGKSGFFPPPESMPALTPETAAYVVELDAQRAYLYNNSQLLAVSQLSSGKKSFRTETGEYVVGQKDLNHRSTTYGSFVTKGGSTLMSDVISGFDPTPSGGRFQGALMKYFQRFQLPNGSPTAMGFHQGVLPGYPASHGCVRLPASMAEWFFKNVPAGTPIYVRGTSNGVPRGTRQSRPKRSPKVHSSLKKKSEPSAPKEVPKGDDTADGLPPAPVTPEASSETTPPAPDTKPAEPATPAPDVPEPPQPNP